MIYRWGSLADAFRNNPNLWLWVLAPVRNCALGEDDGRRDYAVTASAKSSSSISSSIGLKVESGLVESVIGLRLP